MNADRTGAGYCAPMAEIRAEITANVWQVVAEEGQMVAEGDEICILESMKMEIPVITEVPGRRARALRRARAGRAGRRPDRPHRRELTPVPAP